MEHLIAVRSHCDLLVTSKFTFYQAAEVARTQAALCQTTEVLRQADFVTASKFGFYQATEAARIRSTEAYKLHLQTRNQT